MMVIGISNLILDYYFYNDKIYVNGGGTVCNILSNLSQMGIPTKILGYYGNDIMGKVARQSLEEAGVDTSLLETKDFPTKCFFVGKDKTTSRCPICGSKRKNYRIVNHINRYIQSDDIIVVQDYTKLDDIPNKVCLDFGYYSKLIYVEKPAIEKFIFRDYYIVSMKEEVLLFLLKKLNLTFQQFLEQLNIYVFIITKGKKGATIIFKNRIYHYPATELLEVETNGCGDAFFATFISEILKRNKIGKRDLDEIFALAQQNVAKVISMIGARNHIVPNKEVIRNKGCICEDFTIMN